MASPTPSLHDDELRLGDALRALRHRARLTQREAGELAGIRSEFVSKVERGDRGLRWSTLLALLRAYDAGLRELADEIEPQQQLIGASSMSPTDI